jgi:hypothetical protein
MIDRCSRCQREPTRGLPSLGEIYALRTDGEGTRHYWLCEKCAADHILRLDGGGKLFFANRVDTEAHPMSPGADLRLVFRMAKPADHENGSRIYACSALD